MISLKNLVENLADEFSLVTGIDCSVIDFNNPSGESITEKGFCKMCRKYRNQVSDFGDCSKMMKSFCLQADQWGGVYECLCPLSLAFISTMVYGDKEHYGMCLGPFLMMEVDDFVTQDIASHFGDDDRDAIIYAVNTIPYIRPDKVKSFSHLFYVTSCFASRKDSLKIDILEQVASNNKQQYEFISEIRDNALDEYPINSETALMNYIENGDGRFAQQELNKLVSRIYVIAGGDEKAVKSRIAELVTLMSRAAINGGADVSTVFSMNESFEKQLETRHNLNEYNTLLTDIMVKYSNMVFDFRNITHSDIISMIMQYIKRSYMKKIKVQDIADNVGLSVSYISRIFKNEIGLCIIDYLNQVRVDNAKVFLRDKDILLVDVAYLCGFEDQTYFNKVFKKNTGLTPGQYRQRRVNVIDNKINGKGYSV